MSEMIERMAMALANEAQADWEAMPLIHKLVFRSHARAAIEAMMEPTMPMLNAAVDATGAGAGMSWSNRSPQGLFETGHRAMLSAALHGDQEG